MTNSFRPAILIVNRMVASQADPFVDLPIWVNQLTSDTANCSVNVGVDIGHALATQEVNKKRFDLILVLEPSFATWSWSEYQTLQKEYPLARIVTVTGPWSAGGGRSHRQWPGSFYVPLAAFENQLGLFSRQFSDGIPTLWDGPATQSTTERLARANRATPNAASSCVVGLIGRDDSMLQALATACDAMGVHSIGGEPTDQPQTPSRIRLRTPADVGRKNVIGDSAKENPANGPTPQLWIWDWVNPQQEAQQLNIACQLGPMIVLLGYAEIQLYSDQLQLNQQPNLRVLRKPFVLDELQTAIGDLCLQNR